MNKGTDRQMIKATLDWYDLAGVDVIVNDSPSDWFQISKQPPVAPATRQRQAAPPHATASTRRQPPRSNPPKQAHADHKLATAAPAEALVEARELCAGATDMQALQKALEGFDGCALKKMAKNMCFGTGNPGARLMFVGEAPGRDEDLSGIPFVGRAGQLLDKMLGAIDLTRENDVWITNTVYWRPPGNRTPNQQESEVCRPFLERQIELMQPQIIVALGGAAAKHLLQTTGGIMRLRGKWREIEMAGQKYALMPTLHPAYLLRTPGAKKLAWRDLLMIREKLQESG